MVNLIFIKYGARYLKPRNLCKVLLSDADVCAADGKQTGFVQPESPQYIKTKRKTSAKDSLNGKNRESDSERKSRKEHKQIFTKTLCFSDIGKTEIQSHGDYKNEVPTIKY